MRHSLLAILCLSGISHAESTPAANGLQRSLVAREPLIQNPVSVTVDVDGTLYVTETTRRKAADLDIREFTKFGWVPQDVALTSVEEKLAFFKKEITPDRFKGHPSLKDHNQDGVIDIKDLTAFSEKIIRLRDTNGDGMMDSKNTFAEDFNTEVTGIAAGVFAWRGDVYTTIAPDLWKLRDTAGDGIADKRQSLAHGFGVHIAYAGHDMHGLTWGPDGRIYWSIGDKGTNVTTPDGKNHYAPHEGAVLRCYPDGSGFEIFARGLRNPQEIAFNQYGDMFSVDNDADFKGERERFVHITEGSDTGWRIFYQYRGSAYNPWMAENMWETDGPHQPAYITPTTLNYSDGPAGFAFNPGTGLNERYHNAFFVTEFPKGNLRSFKVKTKGATFEITDEHIVDSGPMNVGIQFGPDGALYSADWSGGYPLNEKGAVWRYDDPAAANSPIRREVATLLKNGPSETPTKDLVKQLSHPDQRIRLDAQWELASRKATPEMHQVIFDKNVDQLAKIHALWGLTQQGQHFEKAFHKLAHSADPELRAQAAKHAGETLKGGNVILTKLLADESPRVRFHAATAIWKTGDTSALDAVIAMLDENNNEDAQLRHAGALALSVMDIDEVSVKTSIHPNPAVRLAAAVAFRRVSSPRAEQFLLNRDLSVVAEAARAIYDEPSIKESFPALAALLSLRPDATVPAIRRSIAANRYLGDRESAERLINFAANEASAPAELRIAALEALTTWGEEFSTDPVDGRHHLFNAAAIAIAKAACQPFAIALQRDENKTISAAAAVLTNKLGIMVDQKEMEQKAFDSSAEPATRLQALAALETSDRRVFDKILEALLTDESPQLRSRAAGLLVEKKPAVVRAYAENALGNSDDIAEKQKSVRLLGKLKPDALTPLIENSAEHPALLIELSEAVPAANLELDPMLAALTGGDAELGEIIFNEHLAAQCTACHRIGDEGSNVGPPLTEVGKTGRHYILESLVHPQAQITPGYGFMSLTKKDGTALTGALKEETETRLTLILPDQTEIAVALADIATRTDPISTMPPMGGILTPRQLRDLTEYLSTLK